MRKVIRLDGYPEWSRGEIRFRLPQGAEVGKFVGQVELIGLWHDECDLIGYVSEYFEDRVIASMFIDPGVRDWVREGEGDQRLACTKCRGRGSIPYRAEGVS